MKPWVGVKTVSSSEALKELLLQYETDSNCYFLRWPHKVSGFQKQLPADFPSPEGQLFDHDRELRWKSQGQGYSILLLSKVGHESGFSPLDPNREIEWAVQERGAIVYPATETRFPKGIVEQGIDIAQRYFIDAETSMVHFVALTVGGQS